MTQPTTLKGTQLFIKIGDGGDPESFAHHCLINADRGITFRSNTNDVVVPDCDNPDDPAWRELVKDALSVGVTGAGTLDNKLTTIQTYTTWVTSDDAKNLQVWLGTVGYWSGAFKLTEFAITGARGNKAQVSLTLESDGVVSDFTAP
jgi:predicted secreted protein